MRGLGEVSRSGLTTKRLPIDLTTLPFSLEPIGHSVGLTMAVARRLSPATQALVDSLVTTAAGIDHEGETGS